MGRSIKKGPFIDWRLMRKVEKAREDNSKKPIKTWARSCTIIPEFVGMTFQVHNGKTFTEVFVTEQMVSHKFGEFSTTRTFRGHKQGK